MVPTDAPIEAGLTYVRFVEAVSSRGLSSVAKPDCQARCLHLTFEVYTQLIRLLGTQTLVYQANRSLSLRTLPMCLQSRVLVSSSLRSTDLGDKQGHPLAYICSVVSVESRRRPTYVARRVVLWLWYSCPDSQTIGSCS